jgi:hypothetical protein
VAGFHFRIGSRSCSLSLSLSLPLPLSLPLSLDLPRLSVLRSARAGAGHR